MIARTHRGSAIRLVAILLAAIPLAAISLTACGYSSGMRVSEQHASIGVEFFGNDSYERNLEVPLDNELTRALRSFSDAPIVPSSRAEVVIRGRIRGYVRRGGIRSTENQLLETGVGIEVEATLQDRTSGRILRGPFKAFSSVGYLTGNPNNEIQARDRALRHIAEELVLDIFAEGK